MYTLFSTGCPRCQVLKRKLEEKGIEYEENNSVDAMLSFGIEQIPMLLVDDYDDSHHAKILDFTEAVAFINQIEGE